MRGAAADGRAHLAAAVSVAALALVAALVTISPALRFAAEHGGGTGIVFQEAKDAEFYVAQIRRAADGTYGHANDLLWEWSQGRPAATADGTGLPAPQREANAPPWTYALLGAIRSVTGASPHWIAAWASAVSAALHVVLFFAIARTLRLARAASVAAAAAACLAPFLWSFHGTTLWLGHADRVLTPFLPLWRPLNPSVSSLVVWGAVLALLRWLRRPAWPTWIALTALLSSAWTAYPAAFVFTGAVVGVTAVVELLGRRARSAVALLAVLAVAGTINVASILEVTSGAADAWTGGVALSNMLSLPSRKPILTANVATALALGVAWIVLARRRRSEGPRRAVAVAAPLALVGVFNLQVVTGRLDQPFHYDWFYSVPVVWMMTALVAAEVHARGRRAAAVLADGRRTAIVRGLIVGAAAACVVLCLGGTVTGGLLRGAGLLRGDSVPEPWVRSTVAVAAAAAAVLALHWIATHRWRRLTIAVAGACALLAVAEGAHIQDREYRGRSDAVAARRPLAAALARLTELAAADDVVACSDDIAARWVPSYTGRHVLISSEVQFATAPTDDEFRRRRYVAFALFGLRPDELAGGLGDAGRWHGAVFKWRTFGPPSHRLAILSHGLHAAPLDPGDAERVVAAYRAVAERPRRELLAEFRIDWVLWRDGPDGAGLRDPGPGDGLELAYDADGVRIYRVVR